MIFHDIAQNSPEWFSLRIGVPTASMFDKIITPKKGDFSSQADGYADHLIAELILNESLTKFPPSYWMERGAIHEAEARNLYEFETGLRIANGGFFTNDAMTAGASPDVRVFDDNGKLIGAAEIKCPAPWNHVSNLLRDALDPDYICQVQGQMLIAELEFVDFFSYHPNMPPARVRTYRDDEFCKKLSAGLERFEEMMQKKVAALESQGININRKKGANNE